MTDSPWRYSRGSWDISRTIPEAAAGHKGRHGDWGTGQEPSLISRVFPDRQPGKAGLQSGVPRRPRFSRGTLRFAPATR